jgi:hypothetical protein
MWTLIKTFFGGAYFMPVLMAVLAFGGFAAGWEVNGWRLNSQINRQVLEHQQAIAKKTDELNTQVDEVRRKKDAEIENINNRLVNAVSELRNRPSRPAAEVPNTTACGTGRTLYAQDAEFLIRESARADKIREALDACYAQYDLVTK